MGTGDLRDMATDTEISKGVTVLSIAAGVVAFACCFVFSLWFVDAYYLGDAVHYTRFYNSLYQVPMDHWERLQLSYLSSSEPLYKYVVGIGGYTGIDRVYYISFWNSILAGGIGYLLASHRSSIIFALLLFTNYYLFVLFGSAERLKFAYIFLVLAACCRSRNFQFGFSILSVFFHTQALVQFGSAAAYTLIRHRNSIFTSPLRTIGVIVVGATALAVAAYFVLQTSGSVIISKSEVYSESSVGLSEAIQWSAILIGGVLVFRHKVAFVAGMLPLGLLTALYGNRVNVATLAFFVMLSITQRKTGNPFVLAVMAYMSYKSIDFITSVAQYGTGFTN